MLSGEARPIVIFEKVALGRFSFLIAILQYAVFVLSNPLHIKRLARPAYARRATIQAFVCFWDQIKEGKGTNFTRKKLFVRAPISLPVWRLNAHDEHLCASPVLICPGGASPVTSEALYRGLSGLRMSCRGHYSRLRPLRYFPRITSCTGTPAILLSSHDMTSRYMNARVSKRLFS